MRMINKILKKIKKILLLFKRKGEKDKKKKTKQNKTKQNRVRTNEAASPGVRFWKKRVKLKK